MSALTKNERDGLEDVFLSIHSHADKYRKIKEISSFVIYTNQRFNPLNLIKLAKNRLKKTKFIHFLQKSAKRRKY